MIAKYFASRAGARHSANAVQIMGALGCNDNHSVSRYYRDSKTMEIVEGSNQIHQLLLGKSYCEKSQAGGAQMRFPLMHQYLEARLQKRRMRLQPFFETNPLRIVS